MNQPPKKIEHPNQQNRERQLSSQGSNRQAQQDDISNEIVEAISGLRDPQDETKKGGLRYYKIRDLVDQTARFGSKLNKNLKTNQIRRFLDAVKRINAELAQMEQRESNFSTIQDKVLLLKPQLAYVSGRKSDAKPLYKVMDAAIDRVFCEEDFERLVQLIESIVAYHKETGGE